MRCLRLKRRTAFAGADSGANTVKHAAKIDVESLVPDFIAQLVEVAMRNASAPPSVVDRARPAPAFALHLLEHRAALRTESETSAAERQIDASGRRESARPAFWPLRAKCVVHRDFRALSRETLRDGSSDSAGSARYERRLFPEASSSSGFRGSTFAYFFSIWPRIGPGRDTSPSAECSQYKTSSPGILKTS